MKIIMIIYVCNVIFQVNGSHRKCWDIISCSLCLGLFVTFETLLHLFHNLSPTQIYFGNYLWIKLISSLKSALKWIKLPGWRWQSFPWRRPGCISLILFKLSNKSNSSQLTWILHLHWVVRATAVSQTLSN